MNVASFRPTRICSAALTFVVLLVPFTVLARSDITLSCLANLKQLDGAKATLALEHKLKPGDPVEPHMLSEYIRDYPRCPGGGHYTLGPIGSAPVCSAPGHSEAERARRMERQARRDRFLFWAGIAAVCVPTACLAILAVRRRITSMRPQEKPLDQ